jgi:hypothetical protein
VPFQVCIALQSYLPTAAMGGKRCSIRISAICCYAVDSCWHRVCAVWHCADCAVRKAQADPRIRLRRCSLEGAVSPRLSINQDRVLHIAHARARPRTRAGSCARFACKAHRRQASHRRTDHSRPTRLHKAVRRGNPGPRFADQLCCNMLQHVALWCGMLRYVDFVARCGKPGPTHRTRPSRSA